LRGELAGSRGRGSLSEALADEAVRSNELVYRVGANEISSYAPPSQFVWPHLQTISVLSAMPSQWALQYFALSGGMQLHAAFAHFLGVLAMMPPWMCPLDGMNGDIRQVRCRNRDKG
jgi:hypothetical protein